MPAVSTKQRKWAFGVKGEKWARAHHFDTPGKLPASASKKKAKAKKKPARAKKKPTTRARRKT